MRHHRRQLDQRLHAAERLSQGEDVGALADGDCPLAGGAVVPRRRDETDHATAGATHLAGGQGRGRVGMRAAGQSRVSDGGYVIA